MNSSSFFAWENAKSSLSHRHVNPLPQSGQAAPIYCTYWWHYSSAKFSLMSCIRQNIVLYHNIVLSDRTLVFCLDAIYFTRTIYPHVRCHSLGPSFVCFHRRLYIYFDTAIIDFTWIAEQALQSALYHDIRRYNFLLCAEAPLLGLRAVELFDLRKLFQISPEYGYYVLGNVMLMLLFLISQLYPDSWLSALLHFFSRLPRD